MEALTRESNYVELTCIGCPLGCNLNVEMIGAEIIDVTGYSCKRGKEYAQKELTNPTRIVTSVVKVNGGNMSVVSVKTENDIPKCKIQECIKALKNVEIDAPIKIGDILVKNVASTGVNIVATRNIRKV
ncbi:DUF1667 domain-containing protein [Terrisporobacter vanillatitrophus]|uniref:DUF1667 domain-containing protein n=1 Tax=Terrisporobacter vanillatitrophus TaxID=3058402 RepID=UPI00336897D7